MQYLLCLAIIGGLSAADTATSAYVGSWNDPTYPANGKDALIVELGGNVLTDKPDKVKIVFKLSWDGGQYEYSGWMTPAGKDSKIDGWIRAGEEMYTYTFKGTLKDEVLKADYFSVDDDKNKIGDFEVKLSKK